MLRRKLEAEEGAISNEERRQKVVDIWTGVREEVTQSMFEVMKNDDHGGPGYVNPVYLMSESGARGGREQIRQLSGDAGADEQAQRRSARDPDQEQLPGGPDGARILFEYSRGP